MSAQETYEKTAVDATGTMRHDGSSSIDAFSREVERLRAMEAQGLVRIEFVHNEQQTGARHADLVRFVRLK